MKKYLVGLEINDTQIRYIAISSEGSKLSVYKTGTLTKVVNSTEPGSLKSAVQDILAKEEIEASRIFLTINKSDTVVHQLNLPKMGKKEIKEVVPGEIEKMPKFFSNDFDYVYHISEQSKSQTKVVFAALFDKHLKFYLKDLTKSKYPFNHLDISPLNVTTLLNHIEKTKNDSALLVVNEKFSYLLVVNNGDIKYLYNTNSGLNDIYPTRGAKKTSSLFDSWIQELKRAIKSFMVEQQSSGLNKIWLVYDKDYAPDLTVDLNEVFEGNVQELTFERVNHPKKEEAPDSSNPIHILAATPIIHFAKKIKPIIEFDHFFRDKQALVSLQKTILVTAVILIIAGVGLFQGIKHFSDLAQTHDKEYKMVNQEIKQMREDSSSLFQQRDDYLYVRDRLLEQATYVKLLNKMSWSKVLETVAADMPEELALTKFEVKGTGTALKGQAFKMESISAVMRQLDQSEFLKNARFDFLKEKSVSQKKVFDFGIMANLKINEDDEVEDVR